MNNTYYILKESIMMSSQKENIIFNADKDANLIFLLGAGPGSGKNVIGLDIIRNNPRIQSINLSNVYFDFLQNNKIDIQSQEVTKDLQKKALIHIYKYLLQLSKDKNHKYLITGNTLLLLLKVYLKDEWMNFISQYPIIIIRKRTFVKDEDQILTSKMNIRKDQLLQDFIRDLLQRGIDYKIYSQSMKKEIKAF